MTDNKPGPSTSQNNLSLEATYDDDFEELGLLNESAEIARLDQTQKDSSTIASEDDDRIAKIEFNCTACDMHEMVHFFGQTPPFLEGIEFLEDTYVMRDPFQAPPPRWKPKSEYFIALGAPCSKCTNIVCKDGACSFYYTRTFCLRCAKSELNAFPLEAQAKLRKQLADNKL